jgi:sigma-E factor negative regulatory protein RseA
MSESKFETVSSLVDNYQQPTDVLDELLQDEKLADTWDRYHLIGDVLRNETAETIQLDLSAEIASAIAQEPTVLAPASKPSFASNVKAKVVQFAKPFGQVAIAASAAGLMVLGVQQNVADTETIVPAQIVQTNPLGGVAEPVSFNYQKTTPALEKEALVERQRRFQALLSDHQQQMKLNALVKQEQEAVEKVEDAPK